MTNKVMILSIIKEFNDNILEIEMLFKDLSRILEKISLSAHNIYKPSPVLGAIIN